MEILKKHNLKLSSVKIEFNEQTQKKKIHYINNWLKEKEYINPLHNGFYVKTGKQNNIIVIDIDDMTLEHNKKLIEIINKTCPTLTEETRKGIHYYFKYNVYFSSSNDYELKIDILSDGRNVLCAPTTYKMKDKIIKYTILQDIEINEMHNDVIEYIMLLKSKKGMSEKKEKKNNKIIKINNIDKYYITPYELNDKLNRLNDKYLNNYDDWLKILTVIKNLNKKILYDVFDNWCKLSPKYNTDNNMTIYNSNKGEININYMNSILQDKKIFSHRNIKTMENINDNIEINNINSEYLNLGEEEFKYKTIIIKSDTGTGKTTTISKNIKKIMDENKNLNLISLVPRISLSFQHIKNFKNNNINLLSYQELNKKRAIEYEHKDIVCCINSLLLLKDMYFEDTILFIDEIDSFIQSIIDNSTLKEQKQIYALLMKMINKCNILILSDATINDVIFKFCEKRDDKNKIFINNKYKANKGTHAIQCLNENEFMNLMKTDIENKKYFLACSDKADKITELYNNDKKYASEEDFILITADSKIQIKDAQEEFKNKYVYYSPSITYGVDYNNKEKQNVYIYIDGCSISPIGMYQQINRTRNIDKIYFYINPSIKHNVIKYNSIEETEKYFKNAVENFENIQLTNICTILDENDKLKIIENSFFKLFCHNEYIKNIYNNNKESHFKKKLEECGFIIKILGQYEKINKELKKEMKKIKEENVDDKFNKYIEDFENPEYDDYEKRRKILNIEINNVNDYKEYITNKYAFEQHLNIMDYFKDDEIINNNIKKLKENKHSESIYNNKYVKIKVMRDILKKYNIPDGLNYGDKKKEMKVDIKDMKLIKTTFEKKKIIEINNLYEFNKMHISLIRSIAPIIKAKEKGGKNNAKMHYEYDEELIKQNKELAEKRRNKKEECVF